MADQVVHSAEATRHYPRYKIPAWIEIEGAKYKLDDWSLGGCAIRDLPEGVRRKGFATARLLFPFDTFEVAVPDIKIEFLDRRGQVTGARFDRLTPEQFSLLKEIIDGYLEGSFDALVDQFINVVRRVDLRSALDAKRPKPPEERLTLYIKQGLIFGFLALCIILLLAFLGVAVQERVLTVHTQSAFVEAQSHVVQAPITGYFKPAIELRPGKKIKKGKVIGYIKSPVYGSILVQSPYTGIVSYVNPHFPLVKEGESIVALRKKGDRVVIKAVILHKDLEKLRIGQKAKIMDVRGSAFWGRIEDVKVGLDVMEYLQADSLRLLKNSIGFDTLIIRPLSNSISCHNGEAVVVKISLWKFMLRKWLKSK